jgi:hypothetical protein
MGGTIFSVRVERADVDAANTEPIERNLAELAERPERARRLQGAYVLALAGYDDDRRPVPAIPQTRRFMRRLYERVPHFPYFVAPDAQFRQVALLVAVFSDPAQTAVAASGDFEIDPDEDGYRALINCLIATDDFAREMADDHQGIVDALIAPLHPESADAVRKLLRRQPE